MNHIINPHNLKDHWRFIGLNIVDAMGDKDQIPTVDEFATAMTTLNITDHSKRKVDPEKFRQAIETKYLNEAYFNEIGQSETWQLFKDAFENESSSLRSAKLERGAWGYRRSASDVRAPIQIDNKRYIAAYIWLADHLRAKEQGVQVIPMYFDNGRRDDGGKVFAQTFQPAGKSKEEIAKLPTVFFFGGDGSETQIYSEKGIKFAKEGYRVIIMSDPSGALSDGFYLGKDRKTYEVTRTTGWGQVPVGASYIQLMGGVMNSVCKALWPEETVVPPLAFIDHSAGLYPALAASLHLEERFKSQIKGRIDLGAPWEVAPQLQKLDEIFFFLKPGLHPDGMFAFLFPTQRNQNLAGNIRNMRLISGGDLQTAHESKTPWNAAHAKHNFGFVRDMFYFAELTGNFYNDLQNLKITYPQIVVQAAIDPLVDAGELAVLNQMTTNENSIDVWVYESSGEPKDYSWPAYRKRVADIADLNSKKFKVTWSQDDINEHAFNSDALDARILETLKGWLTPPL